MNTLAARAFAAWPLLVSELLIFGTAAFVLVISPAFDPRSAATKHDLVKLWRIAAVIALIGSPVELAMNAAAMANVPVRSAIALIPEVMRDTHSGRIWAWSFPLRVALAVTAWIPDRWRPRTAVLSAISCTLLFLESLSGHAIDRGALAVADYFVHEVAAALWIGAITGLVIGGARSAPGESWILETGPRVSRVAAWSVAVIAATGAYTAIASIGWSMDRLFYSLYGRTLLWKLATLAAVLLLAANNRYRLLPVLDKSPAQAALLRNVAAECILLAAVLMWSALLANTPPPH